MNFYSAFPPRPVHQGGIAPWRRSPASDEPPAAAWVSLTRLFVVSTLLLCPTPASAQFLGHNYTGDMGLMSGTQAAPGWNLAGVYLRYDGETLRDRDGNSVALDSEERGSLDVNAYAISISYVTEKKVLGGTYGLSIVPAFTDNRFQAPILAINEKVDTGFTDLYIQPITLGWNTKRADFTAGLGIYAPTGSLRSRRR